MLAGLTTSQLVNWRAYFELEPFGFPADERRFVMLATICGQGRVPARAIRYQRRSGGDGRFMSKREISDLVKSKYGS